MHPKTRRDEPDFETIYTLKKKGNGIYAFVLKGNLKINGQELNTRDGFGIWNIDAIDIKAKSNVELLLMEVPMQF